MSSQDPTVLGMINDNLKNINRKIDDVCNSQNALRISDAEMKARLSAVELKTVQTYDDVHTLEEQLREHYKDSKLHFNPAHSETWSERIWRKKAEIIVAAIIGSVAGILALLATYGVI